MKLTPHTHASEKVAKDDTWFDVNQYHQVVDYQSESYKKYVTNSSEVLAKRLNVYNKYDRARYSRYELFRDALDNFQANKLCRINRTLRNQRKWVRSAYINQRLTELGVAPYYRGLFRPEIKEAQALSVKDKFEIFNLCMSDLHWLHAMYREQGVIRAEGGYKSLMTHNQFDYDLARQLIEGHYKGSEESSALLVNHDIQWELAVYRSDIVETAARELACDTARVEEDLRIAAHKNRRRGTKLLAVLPQRLAVWQSTQLSSSISSRAMYENYLKITGSKIAPSTYDSKLKSTNAALAEIGSHYVVALS